MIQFPSTHKRLSWGEAARRYERLRLALMLALVGANLLLLLSTAYALRNSYQLHEKRVETQVQNVAEGLERNIGSGVRHIDLLLQAVADEIEEELAGPGPSAINLNGYVKRLVQRLPEVQALEISDASGRVIVGRGAERNSDVNWAEYDFFSHQRRHTEDKLYISIPRIEPGAKHYVVNFSRRYSDAKGHFAGVVLASVALAHFDRLISGFDVGTHGMVALRDTDRRLISRVPSLATQPAGAIGTAVLSDQAKEALSTNLNSTIYRAVSPLDNLVRIFGVRRLSSAPFILIVGVARDDYLVEWFHDACYAAALLLLFMVLSFLMGRRLLASLAQSHLDGQRLRGLFEMSSLGIVQVDRGGRIVQFNDAFCTICGFEADELVQMDYRKLINDTSLQALTSPLDGMPSGDDPGSESTNCRRKDGNLLPVHLNSVIIRDGRGEQFSWSIVEDISDQKRRESQRQEDLAAMRLRDQALAQISQGVLISGTDCLTTYVNAQFENISGYSRCELLGKRCDILVGPGSDPTHVQQLRDALRSAQAFHGEILNFRKDATSFWSELSITPVFDEGGQLRQFIWVLRDVTERKRVEVQMRKLSRVVEQSPTSIVITDRQGAIEYVNPWFEEITGYTRQEAIGANPRMLKSGLTPAEIYQDMWQLISDGSKWHGELCNRKKTGELYWEYASISGLTDDDGEVTSYIAIKEDISELKQAQARLQLAAKVFSHALEGIMITTPEGSIVDVNAAFSSITGYSREDVLGKNPRLLKSDRNGAEFHQEMWRKLIEHGFWTGENWNRRKNGETYAQMQKISTVRDENGAPLYYVSLFSDITEIQASKEAAQAANLAKSEFLANMSHEIRTPMNGVLGMAQMLMMPDLTEAERVEYAAVVVSSGQILMRLLNDILDLSKIEAGKLSLESSVLQPAQVIDDVQALFVENAREKGLAMKSNWSGPASRYLGDSQRVTQMLSNLVSNAIKFTEQGQVCIEAHEVACTDKRVTLEFSVTDSGIGIAEDKMRLLFQTFSQVDSSSMRSFSGTGLGLSIVRRLAEMMGGGVGVQSQLGEGARFWFRIGVERLARTEPSL